MVPQHGCVSCISLENISRPFVAVEGSTSNAPSAYLLQMIADIVFFFTLRMPKCGASMRVVRIYRRTRTIGNDSNSGRSSENRLSASVRIGTAESASFLDESLTHKWTGDR